MKKKIFLISLMVALFVCVFAISVSAEVVISQNNIDENGDKHLDDLSFEGENLISQRLINVTVSKQRLFFVEKSKKENSLRKSKGKTLSYGILERENTRSFML